jgi:nucleoside-diphosphate-sugar epimerase
MSEIHDADEFYAVLDFSGFEPQWIENAVQVLEDKVRVYIYISTDSVYEVSEGAEENIASNRRGDGLMTKSVESQAIRPKDPTVRQRLNDMDEYGNEKLAGEEVLMRQNQNIPYVALRFADVIGPRDGTERWILYHIWIKYSQAIGIPLSVPNDVANITTSVTFVEDAATSIMLAMDAKAAWNGAYNIACEEGFNVMSGIRMIADSLGVERDGIDIKTMPPEQSFAVYPSVRRGQMDISKARNVLKFTPTPLKKVLSETAEWYESVPMQDELMRQYMMEEFISDVLDDNDEEAAEEAIQKLLSAVGQEYGVDYAFNDDDDEHDEDADHSDL